MNPLRKVTDPVLRDGQLSVFLLAATIIFLIFAASVQLTEWPLKLFEENVNQLFLIRYFVLYGSLYFLLFVCSRPSKSELTVFLFFSLLIGISIKLNLIKLQDPIPTVSLLTLIMTPGCLPILINRTLFSRQRSNTLYEQRFKWLFLYVVLLTFLTAPVLGFNIRLHPQTYDYFAVKFDALFSAPFIPALFHWVRSIPYLPKIVSYAYGYSPLFFLLVALTQLKGRPLPVASAMLTWCIMTSGAWFAFNLFPLTGPRYVFGQHFLESFLHSDALPLSMTQVIPTPRNGMPSMHFGWCLAVSILWWQSGTRYYSRGIMIFLTACVAIATLYLGEHYLIDLIVAVPFTLAAIALGTTQIPLFYHTRLYTILMGVGLWLLWIELLRNAMPFFINHHESVYGLLLLTFLGTLCQIYWMSQMRQGPFKQPVAEKNQHAPALTPLIQFGGLFFISGAAALIYQVLFAKALALIFGSMAIATVTVLVTFLGGMALGSFLGGLLANRTRQPLANYALIEGVIALYAVMTPLLFKGVQLLYVWLAAGSAAELSSLVVLRICLGGMVLLIPTLLMGATLPLLSAAMGRTHKTLGENVAWLYFVNTAGASLGALLATYLIIPSLGVLNTLLIAACLNLFITLFASRMSSHFDHTSTVVPLCSPATDSTPNRSLLIAALLVLGIGGILSLGLEVIYVHMLAIVAGNSVYAFGLMVATFLLGLALGGEAGRQCMLKGVTSAVILPFVLLGWVVSLSVSLPWWNDMVAYLGSFGTYPSLPTFASREAIRGILCALIMIPPTFFIGAAYTLGMDLVTRNTRHVPLLWLGAAATVNTIGNVIGVLLFGFIFLPMLGGFNSIRLISFSVFILAIALMCMLCYKHAVRLPLKKLLVSIGIVGLILVLSLGYQLNYPLITSGANVYFYPQPWGEVLAHTESLDGGLTSINVASYTPYLRKPSEHGKSYLSPVPVQVLTLLTNGKFQGNDSVRGEIEAEIGVGLTPLLHTSKRSNALVIGYGTGTTSRVLHDAGFQNLDIVELSRDVVTLANRYFNHLNHNVTHLSNTHLHLTDGRNFLLLSHQKYELISIEISSIWFAGAASLYNKEFYVLVKQHLTADGVFQQWVQLHHIRPQDLLTIIATLKSEFRYVSLYVVGGQGILVATNDPAHQNPSEEAITILNHQKNLTEVRALLQSPVQQLKTFRLLTPQETDQLLTHYFGEHPELWISNDNNLRLEYDTPKGNVLNGPMSFEVNRAMLKSGKQPR